MPALAVEICLTAFILGTAVTTLPLNQYFASSEFHAYFLNIIGIIHYTLPGVFEGKQLNAQLWTIPFEFECYALLVGLTIATVVRRKHALLALLLAGSMIMTAIAVAGSMYTTNWNVPGRMLVVAFIAGVILYIYRSSVRHNIWIAIACAILSYVTLNFANTVFLAALPLAYLTIYAGLFRPPAIPFGDLSYGVYLFHFPVARALYELSGGNLVWLTLLIPTLIITTVFAAASWRFVEKPVLDRKKLLLSYIDSASESVQGAFASRKKSMTNCKTCGRPSEGKECENCYLLRQSVM